MTLKTELPLMSSDYKIHRIHHFHHHHYHVHHLLDHHHLHIHNQTIHSHNLTVNHNQINNNEHDKYHKLVDSEFSQHFGGQLEQLRQERRPAALAWRRASQELKELDYQPAELAGQLNLKPSEHQQLEPTPTPAANNQLLQAPRLAHVIAPPTPALHHQHHVHNNNNSSSSNNNNNNIIINNETNFINQKLSPTKKAPSSPQAQAFRARQRSQIQFFLVSAFAYILSPIDLIPEMIFGVFGILDDILFLLMCLFCIAIVLLYPLIREARHTILDKLGILNEKQKILENKSF